MSIITLDKRPVGTPYLKRMIRCPGHYLVPPTVDIYLREPVSWLKQCSDFVELCGRKIKIRKERIKMDAYGRKMVDWKKLHKLRDAGIIIQPKVSAAWCIENIYDPLSHLCQVQCRYSAHQPCKEGQGRVLDRTIKRLSGGFIKK
jgi:hypothetical protein